MGAPRIPKPGKAPPLPDEAKATQNALSFAETQRRLREGTGRKKAFSFLGGASGSGSDGTKPLLGL